MVFSISSRQSLEELKPVLELINEVKGSLEGWPVLLVGNKCDEESGKRQVSTKTGEALEVKKSVLLESGKINICIVENVESKIPRDLGQE